VLHRLSGASSAEKLIPFKKCLKRAIWVYECCFIFFFKYYSIAFSILPGIAGGLAKKLTRQKSCTEPFRLTEYARKNSRRLLCGLFLRRNKPLLEVKMAITRQGDRRKGVRRQSGRRKGDIKKIKIGGESDKEQEVTVRHGAIPQKKASSVWMSQYEECAAAWSETFITKKRKRNPKQGK
jgi:hypothetical protein